MKLDQRFRMIFHLQILICQAVRWCPTPQGKRMGERGAGPKYIGLRVGWPHVRAALWPLTSRVIQLPITQTNFSACLIHKKLKTRLAMRFALNLYLSSPSSTHLKNASEHHHCLARFQTAWWHSQSKRHLRCGLFRRWGLHQQVVGYSQNQPTNAKFPLEAILLGFI